MRSLCIAFGAKAGTLCCHKCAATLTGGTRSLDAVSRARVRAQAAPAAVAPLSPSFGGQGRATCSAVNARPLCRPRCRTPSARRSRPCLGRPTPAPAKRPFTRSTGGYTRWRLAWRRRSGRTRTRGRAPTCWTASAFAARPTPAASCVPPRIRRLAARIAAGLASRRLTIGCWPLLSDGDVGRTCCRTVLRRPDTARLAGHPRGLRRADGREASATRR